jgi:ABC-type uncharacterized transport system substrate-binding protein
MKAVRCPRKQLRSRLAPRKFALLFVLGFLPLLHRWTSFAGPSNDRGIFVLVDGSASFYLQASRGFEQKFPQTETVRYYQSGDPRELNATIDALRRDPPRLLVVFGTQPAIAAKSRLRDVPLLYCLALNPVKNGLVGRDVGGVRLEVELSEQLTDLEKLLPHVTRVGVIYSEPMTGDMVRRTRTGPRSRVQIISRDARNPR